MYEGGQDTRQLKKKKMNISPTEFSLEKIAVENRHFDSHLEVNVQFMVISKYSEIIQ